MLMEFCTDCALAARLIEKKKKKKTREITLSRERATTIRIVMQLMRRFPTSHTGKLFPGARK